WVLLKYFLNAALKCVAFLFVIGCKTEIATLRFDPKKIHDHIQKPTSQLRHTKLSILFLDGIKLALVG
ncbi:MAG: hypothetical protein RIM68_14690, partial [Arenibacter sp.]